MSEVSVMMNLEVEEPQLSLPPGFRFHPTDEEVVSYYLVPKALDSRFTCAVIADVDLNKCEPWDLPAKAKMGEKEWFFFCHKDRKYPTGMRTNRATASGYWKATGKDKEIFRGRVLVGMKKTLVFYLGRAPRGEKTPWVMHEYRIEGKLPPQLPRAAKEEWAVCRVFNKDLAAKAVQAAPQPDAQLQRTDSLAFIDFEDFLDTADVLPALIDSPFPDDFADFKAAAGASSSSASVGMPTGAVGYQQALVKTEQQQPAPQLIQEPGRYSFSQPAEQPAIRRESRAARTPVQPADAAAAAPSQVPELDELFPGGLMDFSDMWKF